ncbi:MAG TPA: hypothetical protein VN372_03595 [Methanospirillum sp.]|nr:hypothetical protein [Methanospirillum sp.]
MAGSQELLCPFDKNPCIKARCAIWDEDSVRCSLALIQVLIRRTGSGSHTAPRDTGSGRSGISGQFRDPLFD